MIIISRAIKTNPLNMFLGAEAVLIDRTLKTFLASLVTYSAIMFLNFNRIALIVNSEVAVQKILIRMLE